MRIGSIRRNMGFLGKRIERIEKGLEEEIERQKNVDALFEVLREFGVEDAVAGWEPSPHTLRKRLEELCKHFVNTGRVEVQEDREAKKPIKGTLRRLDRVEKALLEISEIILGAFGEKEGETDEYESSEPY